MTTEIQRLAAERDAFHAALVRLSDPIPAMRGLPPKDRANRLRNILDERIAIAREALKVRP